MKNQFFVLFIIALCSCQPKTKPKENVAINQTKDSLTHKLQTIHSKGAINGFGVAIVNEHGTLYSNGIGYADAAAKKEYTENSIHNIGSVSKTFIGVALLKAQELKQLHLDDPISKYLPFAVRNPQFPEVPITIRHLATHTSTLLDTDTFDEQCYILKEDVVVSDSLMAASEVFNPPSSSISVIEFLEKILKENGEWYEEEGFLKAKPGEFYEYSNVGATLAAAVLERATGASFNQFATEHILKPLEMASSGWSFDDIEFSKHSTLYIGPKAKLPFYSLITYPDGGLITSSSDLAKYLSELIKGYTGEGTLLNPESYRELFREQLQAHHFQEERDTDNEYDDEYNTGIFMGFSPKGYIGHTGGDPGIATFMFFKPTTKTGKLIMINTSVRGSEKGVAEFYDIWYTLDEFEGKLMKVEGNHP
ncbi:serine hydrolase [Ulvibacterium sp.]|uniref:serine hydrolase domain-containing protein n=1 Tax=Ulvibacterium sp. TaxID=2665914 RepID=UPI002610348E|nr:serine hydrolase domain-containing protein [Ulvibacterium sp.]